MDSEYPKRFGDVKEYVAKPDAKVFDASGMDYPEIRSKLGLPDTGKFGYISKAEYTKALKDNGYDILKYDGTYQSTGKPFVHIVEITPNSLITKSQLTTAFNEAKGAVTPAQKAVSEGKTVETYRTSLLSPETIEPSKRIVAPSLPKSGLDTKLSPSLTRTLEPTGAFKSTRYVSPSQLYSLDDPFMPTNYSKVSHLSQVNKESFIDDIARATGRTPDVRIKSKDSFEGKIERYTIKGKDPNTIADNLAGRVVVESSDISKQISNIKKNFEVIEVEDFFKSPTEWGYKGVNIKVRLPNGQLAEIQIHTPESLVSAGRIHKNYEKWRNLDLNSLTPQQIKQMQADLVESQRISKSDLTTAFNEAKGAVTPAQKAVAEGKTVEEFVKTQHSAVCSRLTYIISAQLPSAGRRRLRDGLCFAIYNTASFVSAADRCRRRQVRHPEETEDSASRMPPV